MSMSGGDDCYQALASRALACYDLDSPAATFVRHNENLTFRVAAGSRAYLLRVHRPASANFGGPRLGGAAIASELAWVEALGRQTDILVQVPVRNTAGELVSRIEWDDQWISCSLLTWIEGQPLDPTRQDASLLVRRLAAVVRQLHGHARTWDPPEGFWRPSYDGGHFRSLVGQLGAAVDLGFVTAQELGIFDDVVTEVARRLQPLEEDPEQWGLIHADLGPGNVLVQDDRVAPIDFGLCGFGPFLWDVGATLMSYPAALRPAYLEVLLDGVGLRDEQSRLGDGLSVMSIAGCFALHISDPRQHAWLSARVRRSVEREWLPYLRGEPLLMRL